MRLAVTMIAAVTLSLGGPALAQDAGWANLAVDDPGPSTPEQKALEKEVISFRGELADALRKCDKARLKRYFTADYSATEGGGWVLTREDMLQSCARAGQDTGIEVAEPATMRVRALNSSAAVVTGTSFLDRGKARVAVRWLALYVKGADANKQGWQQAFAQVHRVPSAPPGPPVASWKLVRPAAH